MIRKFHKAVSCLVIVVVTLLIWAGGFVLNSATAQAGVSTGSRSPNGPISSPGLPGSGGSTDSTGSGGSTDSTEISPSPRIPLANSLFASLVVWTLPMTMTTVLTGNWKKRLRTL